MTMRLIPLLHALLPSQPIDQGVCQLGQLEVRYEIIRSKKRRRTIALSIQNGATIRVLAPLRTSHHLVEAFIDKRRDWITRRMAMAQRAQQRLESGATLPLVYLGHSCGVHLTQNAALPIGCTLKPHRMEINLHDSNSVPMVLQQEARLELRHWLKKRAEHKLRQRLDLWAKRFDLPYPRLILSNPKQRWGSCNRHNIIRLNWRLIMLPLPLIDYVAAHDLCHIPHKNHGTSFWRLLATQMPDYPQRRQQLRLFEHELIF